MPILLKFNFVPAPFFLRKKKFLCVKKEVSSHSHERNITNLRSSLSMLAVPFIVPYIVSLDIELAFFFLSLSFSPLFFFHLILSQEQPFSFNVPAISAKILILLQTHKGRKNKKEIWKKEKKE